LQKKKGREERHDYGAHDEFTAWVRRVTVEGGDIRARVFWRGGFGGEGFKITKVTKNHHAHRTQRGKMFFWF